MSDFFVGLVSGMKGALPVLLAIFVFVFCAIIAARVILNYLLERAYQNILKMRKKSAKFFPKKNKKYLKEEDELLRKRLAEIPRAHSEVKAELQAKKMRAESGSYEIIESQEREMDRQEMNQVNIVDIVKPIGFWTSMILGQKLTYLIQSAQILNKRGDKGFWASMIEAKERAAGRQHSRGR